MRTICECEYLIRHQGLSFYIRTDTLSRRLKPILLEKVSDNTKKQNI